MLSNSIRPVWRQTWQSRPHEAPAWRQTVEWRRSVHADERAAVDADRLARDEARLLRAQEGAGRAELGRVAHATQRHALGAFLDVLLHVDPRRREMADAVGEHGV